MKCPPDVYGICPYTSKECTVGDINPTCPKKMTLNDALGIADIFLDNCCRNGCNDPGIYRARLTIRQRLGVEKK